MLAVEERVSASLKAGAASQMTPDEIMVDAVQGVLGRPSVAEQLVLLSTVENVADFDFDDLPGYDAGYMSTVGQSIQSITRAVVAIRLRETEIMVRAEYFAHRAPDLAQEVVDILDRCGENGWVPQEAAGEIGTAIAAVRSGEASEEHVQTLLGAQSALGGLMMSANDHRLFEELGVPFEEIAAVYQKNGQLAAATFSDLQTEEHDTITARVIARWTGAVAADLSPPSL